MGYRLISQKLKSSDFIITILVTAFVIFGIVMVFSASYYNAINNYGTPYVYLKQQSIFAAMGFIAMWGFSKIDYHIFKKYSIAILLLSIILLGLLFTPLGIQVSGATRWLDIKITRLMPGEIAKLAAIIFTAAFLASDSRKIQSFTKGILPLLIVAAIYGVLIIKQPNLSTAITVCGIMIGMMFVDGLKMRYLVGIGGFGALGVLGLIFSDTNGYWMARLTSFANPFADALGSGYQVVQSLLALGTGGLFGLGLGKSIEKNLYLPEPQNDFILAIIGEELGFVGITLIFIGYTLLIWRGFHICVNAPDRFGMLLSAGITIMLGIQVLINVAVVTSSMPPTGITLPFISYGGNALLLFMVSMGILLNISKKSTI